MRDRETGLTREETIEALRADPEAPDHWYALGRLLALAGEEDKARDCFARAVALDPSARGDEKPIAPGDALPDWL